MRKMKGGARKRKKSNKGTEICKKESERKLGKA
jgi:hypothetical protein